jgi:hypothetical protein
MKVAIASRGRAGKVRPLKWLTIKPYLFIEPHQIEEYQVYKDQAEIINIRKDNQGLIYVRNFIFNYFDEPILMLDDDVTNIDERINGKLVKADINKFFEYLSAELKSRDLAQIGISFRASNWLYKKEWKYFDRAWAIKYINVPYLNKKKIRILELGKGLFEDYCLCLQMYLSGFKFATTYKYAFACETTMGKNVGGCQDFRTYTSSIEEAKMLLKKFGPGLVGVKFNRKHGNYEVQIKWSSLRIGL